MFYNVVIYSCTEREQRTLGDDRFRLRFGRIPRFTLRVRERQQLQGEQRFIRVVPPAGLQPGEAPVHLYGKKTQIPAKKRLKLEFICRFAPDQQVPALELRLQVRGGGDQQRQRQGAGLWVFFVLPTHRVFP